ncbi:hypothetical protein H9X96_21875 [Pedobacter sp. N36a]|uniref:hypothetical protein n=1 Tax=Pedobacter sp. N36a TaxID=2767996 RepID=UPI0016569808|nr:hypothetical protein [Pedobacter sp. N36a]MBC8988408.1 hypothetical protein [Pedobacter sp. N36a]
MKKILLSTIVLLSFSLSILLFQISCKKEVKAESPVTSTTLNILVFTKSFPSVNGSKKEIWTANFDGSNQKKVNLQLPSGIELEGVPPILSPDGRTIFFHVFGTPIGNLDGSDIYSCNFDGSNVKMVISHGGTYDVTLGDVK